MPCTLKYDQPGIRNRAFEQLGLPQWRVLVAVAPDQQRRRFDAGGVRHQILTHHPAENRFERTGVTQVLRAEAITRPAPESILESIDARQLEGRTRQSKH